MTERSYRAARELAWSGIAGATVLCILLASLLVTVFFLCGLRHGQLHAAIAISIGGAAVAAALVFKPALDVVRGRSDVYLSDMLISTGSLSCHVKSLRTVVVTLDGGLPVSIDLVPADATHGARANRLQRVRFLRGAAMRDLVTALLDRLNPDVVRFEGRDRRRQSLVAQATHDTDGSQACADTTASDASRDVTRYRPAVVGRWLMAAMTAGFIVFFVTQGPIVVKSMPHPALLVYALGILAIVASCMALNFVRTLAPLLSGDCDVAIGPQGLELGRRRLAWHVVDRACALHRRGRPVMLEVFVGSDGESSEQRTRIWFPLVGIRNWRPLLKDLASHLGEERLVRMEWRECDGREEAQA